MVTLNLSQNLISLSILYADISESEFLEEEVDSWLLFVVGIWSVVSKPKRDEKCVGKTYLSVKIALISFFKFFLDS